MEQFNHYSVLLKEGVDGLNVKQDGIYLDGTLGGGGHSEEILKRGGRVLGLDRDENAVKAAENRLKDYKNFTAVKTNFKNLAEAAETLKIKQLDGILLDLGVSSPQIDEKDRGFSFRFPESKLDMRMDRTQIKTAEEVLNSYDEKELTKILKEYGEERFANLISKNIVRARPLKRVKDLTDIIDRTIPAKLRFSENQYARTFQAIRIEVNNELGELKQALTDGFELLKQGGRFCIITFHSLEDRIVKEFFNKQTVGCECKHLKLSECVCGKKPRAKFVSEKFITPGEKELLENNRSRSSKLRVIEKIV